MTALLPSRDGAIILGLCAALCCLGCVVNPADYAGRACDTHHACFDGRKCILGRCVADAGAGPTGCVRWQQAVNGLGASSACAGCSVTVDGTNANALSATITQAGGQQDFAYAHVPTALLPGTREGRIRGLFSHPGTSQVGDASTFLRIDSSAGVLLGLSVGNNFQLAAFTSGGVLQAASVSDASGPRLEASQPYAVEVAWKQGVFRTVWVDGAVAFDQALTPFTGGAAVPTDLQLGILDYAGNSTQGWTDRLSNWELCDSADGGF